MKRRSLALEDVEGLELDPNLEEPLKAKARRQDSKDTGCSIVYNTLQYLVFFRFFFRFISFHSSDCLVFIIILFQFKTYEVYIF